jgi:hypothetical protein
VSGKAGQAPGIITVQGVALGAHDTTSLAVTALDGLWVPRWPVYGVSELVAARDDRIVV